MYKIAFMVFRETLEISILLGIFIAATSHINGIGYYILLGIMAGVISAAGLGFFVKYISASVGGLGGEIFDATVIMITVASLISTIIWMQHNARKIQFSIKSAVSQSFDGLLPKMMFSFLVASTIFREGTEIMLILYSFMASGIDVVDYITGFGLGTFMGILCGISVYFGLFRISTRYIFKVTTFIMSLIAAGFAAEAAKLLVSCGVINIMTQQAWDTSWLISDESTTGKILKAVMGYSAKPVM